MTEFQACVYFYFLISFLFVIISFNDLVKIIEERLFPIQTYFVVVPFVFLFWYVVALRNILEKNQTFRQRFFSKISIVAIIYTIFVLFALNF